MPYILLLISAVCNGVAQLLRKKGVSSLGNIEGAFYMFMSLLKNYRFLGGCLLYIISIGIWLAVLSKVEVSTAYPMLALAYIIVTFGGIYYFHEDINLLKIFGVICIVGGIILLARS